jgi:hypothetical protein
LFLYLIPAAAFFVIVIIFRSDSVGRRELVSLHDGASRPQGIALVTLKLEFFSFFVCGVVGLLLQQQLVTVCCLCVRVFWR